ncbi:MAG: GntR family transcriptional regulator [Hyphomicrobiales bacterium]
MGGTAEVITGAAPTLAQSICERIRADILSGRRKPGTKLRLDDLKGEFEVSWSPIREALSRLAAEGLIITEGQRGNRVAPVSRAELEDIIRLRTTLEPMALRASIENGDDAWETEVLTAHHRLSKFEDRRWEPDEVEQWERWHHAFHGALTSACNSPILLQFCAQLHELNDRYRRLFLSTYQPDRDVAGEHRAIADATLTHNADKACQLLEKHIQRTCKNILKCMKG